MLHILLTVLSVTGIILLVLLGITVLPGTSGKAGREDSGRRESLMAVSSGICEDSL